MISITDKNVSSVKINADILFDGKNDPVKDSSVVYKENEITYVGPQEGSPDADKEYSTKCVIPGLWDCHVHFFGMKGASPLEWNTTSPITRSARAIYDARIALQYGFTSVREVGGVGLKMREAINDTTILGPNIYSAGYPLGTTGGHSDGHLFPMELVKHNAKKLWGSAGPVDGPWEAVKAARIQFRQNVDLIKIMGSGGVMSQRDSPHHQEFSDEELSAIVKECKSKDLVVASHTHGAAGIEAALKAGVKTIEHGTWLNEELCDLMIEKDAILVPTIYIQKRLHQTGREFGATESVMEKIAEVVVQHKEAMKLAYSKGVQIAMGTDIYSSGSDSMVPWGENAKELEYYVDVGMSEKEALITATSMGPKTLGPRAPKSGQLKVGFDADIVMLNENPFTDITILQNLENISGVIKSGKLQIFSK